MYNIFIFQNKKKSVYISNLINYNYKLGRKKKATNRNPNQPTKFPSSDSRDIFGDIITYNIIKACHFPLIILDPNSTISTKNILTSLKRGTYWELLFLIFFWRTFLLGRFGRTRLTWTKSWFLNYLCHILSNKIIMIIWATNTQRISTFRHIAFVGPLWTNGSPRLIAWLEKEVRPSGPYMWRTARRSAALSPYPT